MFTSHVCFGLENTMKVVETSWINLAAVLRLRPDTTQYREMRKAFFAGASVVMAAAKATGNPDFSEEAGVWIMESMDKEVEEFMASIAPKTRSTSPNPPGRN